MSAALRAIARQTSPAAGIPTTLLELVSALSEVADDDAEVVAVVLDLLASGRIRLCGNFRGSRADDFR